MSAARESSRSLEPEWLDRPELSQSDRRRGIADLRRVNGLLFGRRPVIASTLGALSGRSGRQLVLDVAAGSGDVGAAIVRASKRRGLDVKIVALDRELSHLLIGREWGEVGTAVVASAEALPFRDRSFDLSLSSLFFHHLDREGKAKVAAEMMRVGSRGALIVDLLKSRWATVALRVLFPVLGIGRIAREDGLVSIARGWTMEEAGAFRAGPTGAPALVKRRFPARVSILLRPPAPPAR